VPLRQSSVAMRTGDNDKEDEPDESPADMTTEEGRSPLSRRSALAKTAATTLSFATAAFATNAKPAKAYSEKSTVIELKVETDYLIRVLDFFDGDMRKALGVFVRAPYTTVKIDPPDSKDDAARDAILRALYSYGSPEDYVAQANWVTIEKKTSVLASVKDFLTKERFKFAIDGWKDDDGGKTIISVNVIQVGLSALVLSYPAAFAYFQWESYQDELAAKEKKIQMAAKREAAAAKKKKAAAAAKGKEGGARTKDAPAAKKKDAPVKTAAKKEVGKGPKAQTAVKDASKSGVAVAAQKVIEVQKTVPVEKTEPIIAAAADATTSTSTNGLEEKSTPAATNDPLVNETSGSGGNPAIESVSTSSSSSSNGKKNGQMDAYEAQYAAMVAASQKKSPSPSTTTPAGADTSSPDRSSNKASSTGNYLDNL